MEPKTWDHTMNRDTINRLLETFQESAARGEQARLFLETKNGHHFANFSVRMPVAKPETIRWSKTRKSPSTVRRDQNRMKMYLQKKTFQESWCPSQITTSTPAKEPVQPDLACSSQSRELPTLEKESSSEKTELEKEATKENIDDSDNENKGWAAVVALFQNEDYINDLTEIVSKACKESIQTSIGPAVSKSFGEINEELRMVSSDSQQKSLEEVNDTDNVDNIEEAKLWAVSQKQSCLKT